jgi:hypothetical protein
MRMLAKPAFQSRVTTSSSLRRTPTKRIERISRRRVSSPQSVPRLSVSFRTPSRKSLSESERSRSRSRYTASPSSMSS